MARAINSLPVPVRSDRRQITMPMFREQTESRLCHGYEALIFTEAVTSSNIAISPETHPTLVIRFIGSVHARSENFSFAVVRDDAWNCA